MHNKDDFQGRKRFFENNTDKLITLKYDLWKAMDFEKQVKILSKMENDENDLAGEIFKLIYTPSGNAEELRK